MLPKRGWPKRGFPCGGPGIISPMRVALVTALIAAVLAVPAGASHQTDFNAVYSDWKKDGKITHFYGSQAQLQNAENVSSGNPDFQYDTRFPNATQVEINRWKSGGCPPISSSQRMAIIRKRAFRRDARRWRSLSKK